MDAFTVSAGMGLPGALGFEPVSSRGNDSSCGSCMREQLDALENPTHDVFTDLQCVLLLVSSGGGLLQNGIAFVTVSVRIGDLR